MNTICKTKHLKLANKYQWMGVRTCYVEETEANKFDSQWIRSISRRGLYLPSLELKQLVDSMERDFQRYHGPALSLEQNSIQHFSENVEN